MALLLMRTAGVPTPDPDTTTFAADLRSLLAGQLDDQTLELQSIERRGEGYSWETYLVEVNTREARSGAESPRFAVKREPRAGLLGVYDVQREVELLTVTREKVGCPVPGVVGFRLPTNGARGFYVMEMVSGVVPMPWNVRKVIPDEATRHRIGLELASVMARLHKCAINDLHIGDMAPPSSPAATGLLEARKWQDVYHHCAAVPVPIIDLAFSWLLHRCDAVSGRVALVHNDLRIGNVVIHEGRVAAILDWETAQFSDPAADLAKFNLPTFRGRSALASGLIDWEAFLAAYEAQTGWRPSRQTLEYWTVLEIVKAAVGGLRGRHYFDLGQTSDIRYANMGWQVHHAARWLVELFESGAWGR